jgi:peptide chain release factor subunit 3
MLEDPDELMKHPDVIKALGEGDAADDWEAAADESEKISQQIDEKLTLEEKADTSVSTKIETVSSPAVSVPKKSVVEDSSSNLKDATLGDDEELPVDDEVIVDDDAREHMNLVFIGHVDAGKSTLSGNILYLMGQVDARTIERFEREAKQRNRDSWFLAFIMDTSEEERAKGKTVEVGRAYFSTDIHRYTILDAPGHKNYVPNMISGAAQADIGVLVISARKGEFETGFEKGGQTREHALLAKTLGVRYLVVVINKMDDPTVQWSKDRYEECVNKLKPYLKSCGYAIKRDVRFIPISGLGGANVLNEVPNDVCPWWQEMYTTAAHSTTIPTLIATLDSFHISDRDPNGPLRIPCLDRYMERGCVVLGKVESGTLRVGEEVAMLPTRKVAKVEGIYINEVKVRSAKPGENVLIKFQMNVDDIQKGYVISSLTNPCPATTDFVAQLALVDMVEHRPVFTAGYDCVMHIHTVEVECTCVQLISVTDKQGVESRKRFALQGQMCVVRLRTPLTTCMEAFSNMPALGRITLRDEGRTIAIGKVMQVLKPTSAAK